MTFTFFATKESTTLQPRNWEWSQFVDAVMKGHETLAPELKDYRWAFNAIEYKAGGRRQSSDAVAVHALVLDFDEKVGFHQMCAVFNIFKKCELVAYTSFNHQRKKNEGDYERDKFRVVIPLATPIPADVWPELTTYIFEEFAPDADKQGASLAQHYSWTYVPEQTKHLAATVHMQGQPLDWTAWPRVKNEKRNADGTYKKAEADHFLEPGFTFRTATGTIAFSDVTSHTNVYCPHHADKSPGSFVNKRGATIYHHCNKCGTTKIKAVQSHGTDDAIRALVASKPTLRQVEHEELSKLTQEELERRLYGEDNYLIPYDRDARSKLLEKHCLRSRHNQLLFTPEGFGKSYLAVLWARKLRKVLFACGSNRQAAEQAEGFRQKGLRVQAILGRQYRLLAEHGIKAVMNDKRHPWDTERINESATIKLIMQEKKCSKERAKEIWVATGPAKPDWDNHEIVVTTIARTMAFGQVSERSSFYVAKLYDMELSEDQRKAIAEQVPDEVRELVGDVIADAFDSGMSLEDRKQVEWKIRDKIVPEKCVVFFDDTPRHYFRRKEPVRIYHSLKAVEVDGQKQYVLTGDGEAIKVDVNTINGRQYFMRPKQYVLGFGLDHCQLVFTTTEIVSRELILKMYPDMHEPPLMPARLDVGSITMIKTRMVGSKRDGFLPPIMNRIKKTHAFEYFANGQGTQHNLESSKGNNSFAQSDIVVECSVPHFFEVTQYLDELDLQERERPMLELALAMDTLQQALGRNSGYRWWDLDSHLRKRAVVLCDPKLFKKMIEHMRYRVRVRIEDPSKRVNLVDPRMTLVDEVCWYVTYLDQYLNGIGKRGQAFEDDVSEVMTSIDDTRRMTFRKRLCIALDQWLANARKSPAPNNSLVEKVHRWWIKWGGELFKQEKSEPIGVS